MIGMISITNCMFSSGSGKISGLFLIIFLVFSSLVEAQKPFKGRIVYEITYPGSTVDLAELQELPGKMDILTKNGMVRAELSGENAGLFQVKIVLPEEQVVKTMLEIMNEKYVITKTFEEIEDGLKNMAQPEFEYTNETKEILGYECKKVIARITDDFGIEHESEIFYTPEISGEPFNFDTPYNEIPGLMLEYTMRVGQLNIYYVATSVNKKLFVRGRNFYVTRDYQPIELDELRKELGGEEF